MCRMPNKKRERTSGEKNAHTPTKHSLTFDWQFEFIFIVERRKKQEQQQNIGTYFMAMEKMIMMLVLVDDYHHHHFHHHHHLESGWFIKETAIKAAKHPFPPNTGKKKQTAILNGPQELRRLCCFGSHPPWLNCKWYRLHKHTHTREKCIRMMDTRTGTQWPILRHLCFRWWWMVASLGHNSSSSRLLWNVTSFFVKKKRETTRNAT